VKQPEFIPGVRSRLDDSLHSTIRPERALFGGITFPNLHHKHEPIHRGKLGYGIDCGTCPCFTWFLPPRIGRFLIPGRILEDARNCGLDHTAPGPGPNPFPETSLGFEGIPPAPSQNTAQLLGGGLSTNTRSSIRRSFTRRSLIPRSLAVEKQPAMPPPPGFVRETQTTLR